MFTGVRELLSHSDASGAKSTILKPLTWFLALIIGGILLLLKFSSPIWLTIMLAIIFCLGVAVFFFVYIYCLIKDRDSLRSEKFSIQKLAIEKDIPCQISLEEKMACGLGVCLGCAVKTAKSPADAPEYWHVCKAGPVFQAKDVDI